MAPLTRRGEKDYDQKLAEIYGAVVIISSSSESELNSDSNSDSSLSEGPISLRRKRRRSVSYAPRDYHKTSKHSNTSKTHKSSETHSLDNNRRNTSRSKSPAKRRRLVQKTSERGSKQTGLTRDSDKTVSKTTPTENTLSTNEPLQARYRALTSHRRSKARPIIEDLDEIEDNDVLITGHSSLSQRQEGLQSQGKTAPAVAPTPSSNTPSKPTSVSSSLTPSVPPSTPHPNRLTVQSHSQSLRSGHPPVTDPQSSPAPVSRHHNPRAQPATNNNSNVPTSDALTEISHDDYENQPRNRNTTSETSSRRSNAYSRASGSSFSESQRDRRIDAGTMATRTRGTAKKILMNEATGEPIRVFIAYRTRKRLALANQVKKLTDKDLLSKPRHDSLNLAERDYVGKLASLPLLNSFVFYDINLLTYSAHVGRLLDKEPYLIYDPERDKQERPERVIERVKLIEPDIERTKIKMEPIDDLAEEHLSTPLHNKSISTTQTAFGTIPSSQRAVSSNQTPSDIRNVPTNLSRNDMSTSQVNQPSVPPPETPILQSLNTPQLTAGFVIESSQPDSQDTPLTQFGQQSSADLNPTLDVQSRPEGVPSQPLPRIMSLSPSPVAPVAPELVSSSAQAETQASVTLRLESSNKNVISKPDQGPIIPRQSIQSPSSIPAKGSTLSELPIQRPVSPSAQISTIVQEQAQTVSQKLDQLHPKVTSQTNNRIENQIPKLGDRQALLTKQPTIVNKNLDDDDGFATLPTNESSISPRADDDTSNHISKTSNKIQGREKTIRFVAQQMSHMPPNAISNDTAIPYSLREDLTILKATEDRRYFGGVQKIFFDSLGSLLGRTGAGVLSRFKKHLMHRRDAVYKICEAQGVTPYSLASVYDEYDDTVRSRRLPSVADPVKSRTGVRFSNEEDAELLRFVLSRPSGFRSGNTIYKEYETLHPLRTDTAWRARFVKNLKPYCDAWESNNQLVPIPEHIKEVFESTKHRNFPDSQTHLPDISSNNSEIISDEESEMISDIEVPATNAAGINDYSARDSPEDELQLHIPVRQPPIVMASGSGAESLDEIESTEDDEESSSDDSGSEGYDSAVEGHDQGTQFNFSLFPPSLSTFSNRLMITPPNA